MKILIIADFCGDLDGNENFRFTYLANLLSKKHFVELVTSDFNHAAKAYFDNIAEYPFKITMLHEKAYPKNICLKRFYSHYSWGVEVDKYLKRIDKPDVIYCAVPTLSAAAKAGRFCKKNNIKFIVDIQDLWPEAFRMAFNIPIISDLIFWPFKIIANRAYISADEIVAVSNTYVERAISVNKRVKKGKTVFLGTNLDTFDKNAESGKEIEKNKDEIWLAYCGSLAASYDIPLVIDAIEKIEFSKKKNLKFIVMGDGSYRKCFEELAKKKEVTVVFTGALPYERMCSILCQCDITVNPILKGSAASIINKHADYAASGLPVINTQESKEYRDLVDEYEMGFNCNNGDAADLANKLQILLEDKEVRERMGFNARKCAEERFDRKNTYNQIVELLKEN